MSLTQRLAQWVNDHRGQLETAGAVTLRMSDPDIEKPSAHLLVQGAREAELILWESGELEVWVDVLPVEDHYKIDDPATLTPILAAFLDCLTRD